MNTEWVDSQLVEFLQLTELYRPTSPPGVVNLTPYLSNRGQQADIVASAQVVEQILDRLAPR